MMNSTWDHPARAGKTHSLTPPCLSAPDHPRACGENSDVASVGDLNAGSPPRVRGKLEAVRLHRLVGRITPARAGKTAGHSADDASGPDHPPACGENVAQLEISRIHAGSPPRVRGKPRPVSTWTSSIRITPARAGKTQPQ